MFVYLWDFERTLNMLWLPVDIVCMHLPSLHKMIFWGVFFHSSSFLTSSLSIFLALSFQHMWDVCFFKKVRSTQYVKQTGSHTLTPTTVNMTWHLTLLFVVLTSQRGLGSLDCTCHSLESRNRSNSWPSHSWPWDPKLLNKTLCESNSKNNQCIHLQDTFFVQ